MSGTKKLVFKILSFVKVAILSVSVIIRRFFAVFRLKLGFLCVVLVQPFMRQKVVGALYVGLFHVWGRG